MTGISGARGPKLTQTTAVLAMCAVLIVVFSIFLNGFLTLGNLFALARNIFRFSASLRLAWPSS